MSEFVKRPVWPVVELANECGTYEPPKLSPDSFGAMFENRVPESAVSKRIYTEGSARNLAFAAFNGHLQSRPELVEEVLAEKMKGVNTVKIPDVEFKEEQRRAIAKWTIHAAVESVLLTGANGRKIGVTGPKGSEFRTELWQETKDAKINRQYGLDLLQRVVDWNLLRPEVPPQPDVIEMVSDTNSPISRELAAA